MHNRVFLRLLSLFCFATALAVPFHSTFAQNVPEELKGVGITEHLGAPVSVGKLVFRDETGKSAPLSSYLRDGHPVLLNLVYFECPNLCNFLLNGMMDTLKQLDWTPGDQFDIVTVSINPKEGPELAAAKKAKYLEAYGRPAAARGWHFLTGTEDQIRKLADEVGFGYKYDDREKQYAHTAALFVLTPEGKISRYLYGIQFPKKDLRLALLEASSGKIGTVVDRILLFCFHYDPQTGKYSVYVNRLMQTGCAGTVVVFGAYLAVFWRKERDVTVENPNEKGDSRGES